MTVPRLAAILLFFCPAFAFANAGYFQLGYGIKSKGMAGVSLALPQDALAAASNPAGMAWIGNRIDAGLERIAVDHGSEIIGNTLGLNGSRDANGRKVFLAPEFGINHMLNERVAIGLSVYGNGGMTRYRDNPLASLGGSTPAGLEYVQAIVAPSLAVKLGERYSVGVALNLIAHQFAARGIQHFDDPIFSASPGNVTNRGRDGANGVGLRIGGLAHLSESVSLGASYQPRVQMGRFDAYKGLLADRGRFDVPENYGVGVAWKTTRQITVAGDIQRINYGSTPGIGGSFDCFLAVRCLLGSPGQPGAGWRGTTVYKLGVSWTVSAALTLRAGFAWLREPIPESQTLLNVFAPAVASRHLSFGATWHLTPQWELSASYLHGFGGTLRGSNSIPPGFPPGGVGGGEASLQMSQSSLGLSLAWKY